MIKLSNLLKESIDEYKHDWITRHNAQIDDNGRIIAYHGTTPSKAKLIKTNGFKEGSYFSLRKEYSKHWGSHIFKVHLPIDAIDFVASDIYSTRPIKYTETLPTTNMSESHPTNEIFGLGVVDFHGAVHFKKVDKDYMSTMTHHSAGLPRATDRFRYNNGVVEWTDKTDDDTKMMVTNYLTRKGYKVEKHKSYWWDDDETFPQMIGEKHHTPINKIVTLKEQNLVGLKFWWMDTNYKFHPVSFEQHRYWAESYLKNIGYANVKDVYKTMYKLGFVRVVKQQYGGDMMLSFQYSHERPISSKQLKYIKDLAIEENCEYLIDDTNHKETRLAESFNWMYIKENMTYNDLIKLTANTPRSPDDGTNRIERSKNIKIRNIPVSVEDGLEQWNFRYKSSPNTGNPGDPLEGHITFIKGEVNNNDNAEDLECKVDCSCRDYKYKFAYNNFKQGASDIGPDSLNKCINSPPKSAYDIGEGLCKHLSALAKYLKTKIDTQKSSNLFEAIDKISKQGPFNITYYD